MDRIEAWHGKRTKVPPGQCLLNCVTAENAKIWCGWRGGWGRSGKIVLWFERGNKTFRKRCSRYIRSLSFF